MNVEGGKVYWSSSEICGVNKQLIKDIENILDGVDVKVDGLILEFRQSGWLMDSLGLSYNQDYSASDYIYWLLDSQQYWGQQCIYYQMNNVMYKQTINRPNYDVLEVRQNAKVLGYHYYNYILNIYSTNQQSIHVKLKIYPNKTIDHYSNLQIID